MTDFRSSDKLVSYPDHSCAYSTIGGGGGGGVGGGGGGVVSYPDPRASSPHVALRKLLVSTWLNCDR